MACAFKHPTTSCPTGSEGPPPSVVDSAVRVLVDSFVCVLISYSLDFYTNSARVLQPS